MRVAIVVNSRRLRAARCAAAEDITMATPNPRSPARNSAQCSCTIARSTAALPASPVSGPRCAASECGNACHPASVHSVSNIRATSRSRLPFSHRYQTPETVDRVHGPAIFCSDLATDAPSIASTASSAARSASLAGDHHVRHEAQAALAATRRALSASRSATTAARLARASWGLGRAGGWAAGMGASGSTSSSYANQAPRFAAPSSPTTTRNMPSIERSTTRPIWPWKAARTAGALFRPGVSREGSCWMRTRSPGACVLVMVWSFRGMVRGTRARPFAEKQV